jgi:arylsulfatase A-like enzyme
VVDALGLKEGAPFVGESWVRYWGEPSLSRRDAERLGRPALAEVVPDDPENHDDMGLPKRTWPLGAVTARNWSYVRREGVVQEELFDLRADPRQQRNLAGDPAEKAMLEQMREALERLTAGPLMPWRFRR